MSQTLEIGVLRHMTELDQALLLAVVAYPLF